MSRARNNLINFKVEIKPYGEEEPVEELYTLKDSSDLDDIINEEFPENNGYRILFEEPNEDYDEDYDEE